MRCFVERGEEALCDVAMRRLKTAAHADVASTQAKKKPGRKNRALKGSLKRGFREDPRRQLEINELIDVSILW